LNGSQRLKVLVIFGIVACYFDDILHSKHVILFL
jgi:hypothetical protein